MKSLNESLRNFALLPDEALVRVPVVAALNGVSTPTVWRWVQLGRLPKPVRRGRTTAWRVGDLRTALKQAK
jgi:predicted DNA-binding transcriptional regulator AlpA